MDRLTPFRTSYTFFRRSFPCRAAEFVAVIALGAACASNPAKVRSVAEEAAQQEKARCTPGTDEGSIAQVFTRDAVESVEPLYTAASIGGTGTGGNYTQLLGAIVRLRAIKGVSAEWLDQALECHSARRLLGQIQDAGQADPFWLPGRMVDIEAVAAHGGYQVYVRGKSIKDAEAILARANAFFEASTAR